MNLVEKIKDAKQSLSWIEWQLSGKVHFKSQLSDLILQYNFWIQEIDYLENKLQKIENKI